MKIVKGGLNAGFSKANKPEIVENTTGIQYSALLIQLATPHFGFDEEQYILDMAATAWNLAVYKKQIPDFYKEIEKQLFFGKNKMSAESAQLIKKIMKEKEKLFPEYDVIIRDCFLKNRDGELAEFKAMTMAFSGMAMNVFPESIDNRDYDEYEEIDETIPTINRHAVVIKPKQPLKTWLEKIFFPDPPPEKFEENNVYLVPEKDSNEKVMKWLGKNYEQIFENELWSWHTDSKEWPQNRTFKLFKEWFTIEINSMVFDLGEDEIMKE